MKFERSGCTTCGLEIPSADSAARWNILCTVSRASAVARRKAMWRAHNLHLCRNVWLQHLNVERRIVSVRLGRCVGFCKTASSCPWSSPTQDSRPTTCIYLLPVGLRSLLCAHKAVFILDCSRTAHAGRHVHGHAVGPAPHNTLCLLCNSTASQRADAPPSALASLSALRVECSRRTGACPPGDLPPPPRPHAPSPCACPPATWRPCRGRRRRVAPSSPPPRAW